MYQLCRSIAYIHSLGICHRDIKPQNLVTIIFKSFSYLILSFWILNQEYSSYATLDQQKFLSKENLMYHISALAITEHQNSSLVAQLMMLA